MTLGIHIEAFATRQHKSEIAQKRQERAEKIKHFLPLLEVVKTAEPHMRPVGRTYFRGVLPTPETQALSESDLAILVDSCQFGAFCKKNGNTLPNIYIR